MTISTNATVNGSTNDGVGGSGTGVITSYTAAQLAAMALAGTLTPNASYRASDTGARYFARNAYTLEPDGPASVPIVQIWGNSDNTTRQGSFVVPRGQTSLLVSLYGPGGNGGNGSASHATDYSGGGGGSPGEVLELAEFPVVPGTTIYYQVGAPGSPTYLKRGSHSGTVLGFHSVRGVTTATVDSGNNGGTGTTSTSGDGAAGVGTFYGRTAGAAVAGRTTAGNGSNANGLGGTCTLVANRLIGYNTPKKVGGLGGGNGALELGGATSRNAGFGANVAIILDGTNAIDGLTGQGGGTSGSSTVAAGGAGASAIITQFKTSSANGGGATAPNGVDAEGISCSGGGGAGGTSASVANVAYGGMGGVGHITIHNWGGSIEDAPPSRVLYTGAGIAVPSTFVGLHTYLYGFRLGTLTFNTGSDNFTTTTTMYDSTLNKRKLVFRSGTPPTTAELGALALDTPYWMKGTSSPWQLCATDGGAALNITAAGTSPVGEQISAIDEDANFDFGAMRSLSVTAIHWGSLHTGDGTYSATNTAILDRVKAGLDADGRKLIYTFIGTPNLWASAGPTANAYSTGAQEAPTRSALGDGKIPIRQFVNWLVTRMGSTLAAIECWNEPRLDGTANGYFKGTATDMVQIAIDIDAELTLMGSSIPLIGPGSGAGGSVIDGIRNRTATTYATYMFLSANVGGTYGHQVIDGLSLHPYGTLTTSEPPADVSPFKHDISRLVNQSRRVLQEVGAADYATKPIWFSEVGIDTNGTDLEARWPQLTPAYAALSQILGAAGAGAYHFNIYADAANGLEYRYMSRDATMLEVIGGVHNRIAGKTLTYCAVRADGAYVTTTSEGGTVVWAPTPLG